MKATNKTLVVTERPLGFGESLAPLPQKVNDDDESLDSRGSRDRRKQMNLNELYRNMTKKDKDIKSESNSVSDSSSSDAVLSS